ncbi:MAG: hypothetical protein Q4D55_09550 [Eubacteriales bacterium]|nr:hypothetical protein [Eubacteriales bacterium]
MEYKNLGSDRRDIYWIYDPVGAPHWTEERTKCFEGKENAPMLGVSNHNLSEIKGLKAILEAYR